MTQSDQSITITDLHLVATVEARGEAAWAAARAIDDALWHLGAPADLPQRTILVDDVHGRISLDTPGRPLLPGEHSLMPRPGEVRG